MIGYRNAAYNPRERCVELFTWDEEGVRIQTSVPFQPYLYLEDPNGKATSIFQTPLRKKIFQNSYERRKYIADTNNHRLFENFGPVQQSLLDMYWEVNEQPEFTKFPLKIQFIDIEVVAQEFPKATDAKYSINVITVYDSLLKKFFVWGEKPYKTDNPNVVYVHCESEVDLLTYFINFIKNDFPDILSGWNSAFFDIPYIINRIKNVLGDDYTKELSPVNNIYARTFMGKFGQQETQWHIDGISCVDYLDIYKRFCTTNRESYRLGYIGEVELNETKVEFGETNLVNLMKNDWNKFVDYNIQDVNLLVKLEEKLRYIELLRMLAYVGLTTFEGAMGTLSVITGATAIRARKKKTIISTFIRDEAEGKNPGAFVAEPQKGIQESIVSFDANSLYPNVMISLNMSPETKIGKIIEANKEKGTVTIRHVNGKIFTLTNENFARFIKTDQVAISKAKVLFSQKTTGIMPDLVDYYYKERKKVQIELKKIKKEISETEDTKRKFDLKMISDRLNAKQLCIKIFINSVYGFFGNKQAPFGDDDIASSITLTGQAIIKQAAIICSQFLKQEYDVDVTAEQVRAYGDTDSVYFSLKHIPNLIFSKKGKVTKDAHAIVEKLGDYLNIEIVKWAKKTLNSQDCRLNFKRETLADAGIFVEKKRYVLHVLDDEGIACDKWKYVGVEVVRTTMPKPVKPLAKAIIETIITNKNRTDADKKVLDAYDTFKNLSVEEIAFTSSISKYESYASKCNGFVTVKRMPCHVKGAYFYNLLLEKLNLTNQYEKIASGDKIKYLYVQTPNKFGISVIGFKYRFPKEFMSLFTPDIETMYEKILHAVVTRYYSAVNWQARKPSEQTQCDLFDIFG